jgi:GDPmannose 4,6-dehydratase
MKSSALIVGSGGQDGRLLSDLLSRRGYAVTGLRRGELNLGDPESVTNLLADLRPNEIYYLAAHHHSSEDEQEAEGELLRQSMRIHFDGLVNILEAIRIANLQSRVFYAASALVFSPDAPLPHDEQTPLRPDTAYGISKAAGLLAVRRYRDKYGVFVSTGILFNHESPLRPEQFLSKKLSYAAVQIARNGGGELQLGDLDAQADWGYAPDFVEAMSRILALPYADDFVIATGEAHTVAEFANYAFGHVGLDYQQYVRADSDILQRRFPPRLGNPAKLRAATGWHPTLNFAEMVARLVEAEVERSDAK